MLVKFCFSLHFIPLDPQTQMNADPTGSTSLDFQPDLDLISRLEEEEKNRNAKIPTFSNVSCLISPDIIVEIC